MCENNMRREKDEFRKSADNIPTRIRHFKEAKIQNPKRSQSFPTLFLSQKLNLESSDTITKCEFSNSYRSTENSNLPSNSQLSMDKISNDYVHENKFNFDDNIDRSTNNPTYPDEPNCSSKPYVLTAVEIAGSSNNMVKEGYCFNPYYTNPYFIKQLSQDGFIRAEEDKSFEASIHELIYNFEISNEKKFKLEPMSRMKRLIVHQIAAYRGMKTHSVGSGTQRHVIVRRSQQLDLNSYADASNSQQLILNDKQNELLTDFLHSYPVNIGVVRLYLSQGYSSSSVNCPEILRKNVDSQLLIPPMLNEQNFAMQRFRKRLPIYKLRETIVRTILGNNVTIIVGGTGCGKTTQVPQFIMEDAARKKQPVRIYCTQPRRLPAVAVATRVARERNERIGSTVGYHIRLEQKTSSSTILTYCTSGVLLRLLANDSATENISHIILDEIHEREQKTDFLLITLREVLKIRSDLKVILMSATMEENKNLFKNYFSKFNVGCIEVPSSLFKVDIFHLPQVLALTSYRHKSTFSVGNWTRQAPRSLNSNRDRFNSFPTVDFFQCETSSSKSNSARNKISDNGHRAMMLDDHQSKQHSMVGFSCSSFEHNNEKPVCSSSFLSHSVNLRREILGGLDNGSIYPHGYKSEQGKSSCNTLQQCNDFCIQKPHTAIPTMNFLTQFAQEHQKFSRDSFLIKNSLPNFSEEVISLPMKNIYGAPDRRKCGFYANNSAQEYGYKTIGESNSGFYKSYLPYKPNFFESQCVQILRETKLDTLFLTDRYMIEGGEQWIDSIDTDLIIAVIRYCMGSSIEGSILVFLPGYDDILEVKEKIMNMRIYYKQPVVFMLHSQIGNHDQQKVFETVDRNYRKIILSTNIAEASLTIDDVVFVIDCGKVKEMNYDHSTRINQLKMVSIAKSSAEQRAGRAGRCRNGYCFRLYTNEDYDAMIPSQIPEMKRTAIHEVCLHAKMFAPRGVSVRKFLSWAPEPPPSSSVEKSLDFLHHLGALFSKNKIYVSGGQAREEDAELTELGYHIAKLPLDPQLARLLLFGLALKCLEPVISLVAALSYREPFVLPLSAEVAERNLATAARDSFAKDGLSDHLALLRAFYDFDRTSPEDQAKFCHKNFLSYSSMKMIAGIRLQLFYELRRLRLLPVDCVSIWNNNMNLYSCSWPMIQAAIVAGCYPGIGVTRPHHQIRKIRTCNETAYLNQGCALKRGLYKKTTTPIIEHLAFQELKQSGNNITIRTVTAVPPLVVLFFAGPLKLQYNVIDYYELDEDLVSDKDDETSLEVQGYIFHLEPWLPFNSSYEDLRLLLKFRIKLMLYFFHVMKNPLKSDTPENRILLEKLNYLLVEDYQKHSFPFCDISSYIYFCETLSNSQKSTSKSFHTNDNFAEDKQQGFNSNNVVDKKKSVKEVRRENPAIIFEQQRVTQSSVIRADNQIQNDTSLSANFLESVDYPNHAEIMRLQESQSNLLAECNGETNDTRSGALSNDQIFANIWKDSFLNGVVASKVVSLDQDFEEQIPDDPCCVKDELEERYLRNEDCSKNFLRNSQHNVKVGEVRVCSCAMRGYYRSNRTCRSWRKSNFDRKQNSNFNPNVRCVVGGMHQNTIPNQESDFARHQKWKYSGCSYFSGSRTFIRRNGFAAGSPSVSRGRIHYNNRHQQ